MGGRIVMVTALDVVVIGGCGRAGLPLGLAFADRGMRVGLYDIDTKAVESVAGGRMPFAEAGADGLLRQVLDEGRLWVSSEPSIIGKADAAVVVIGTPVDEHLNPDIEAVSESLSKLAGALRTHQLLVLRSTVYPGVTAKIEAFLRSRDLDVDVAFCPERIAEGRALRELYELPQIISGRSPRAVERAEDLFRRLTPEIIRLTPEEAEVAKLFTNAWRYIKFAAANQFYMIANDFGLDFEKIREALAQDYPRAWDMPPAGFAAGPCLFKDTAQLAAFHNNNFHLGQSSMAVNEGLPLYVVSRLERRFELSTMTVGILGMAYKGGSDDSRSSLSYKLKRILRFKAKAVLCTDPHVKTDPDLVPIEEVLSRADVLVVGTPHPEYSRLDVEVPVADIWGVLGKGVLI
jgi:UDP-N-acetyl-D-mannosaminuronic acid dehydrogenase